MLSEQQLLAICNSEAATKADLDDALWQMNALLTQQPSFIHACAWYQQFINKLQYQKNQFYLQQNISLVANKIYPPPEPKGSFGFTN